MKKLVLWAFITIVYYVGTWFLGSVIGNKLGTSIADVIAK